MLIRHEEVEKELLNILESLRLQKDKKMYDHYGPGINYAIGWLRAWVSIKEITEKYEKNDL